MPVYSAIWPGRAKRALQNHNIRVIPNQTSFCFVVGSILLSLLFFFKVLLAYFVTFSFRAVVVDYILFLFVTFCYF